MLFNSLQYAVFFPIVFILYWILPASKRWILLLVSSYYFYMSWNPKYIFLIMFTTVISYFCALLLEKTKKQKYRKYILSSGILCTLGILFLFKYFNFSMEMISAIFAKISIPIQPFTLKFLLPVGISFYTFQTLSYIIDVYRGKSPAEHHLGKYAAFISFFPQLVAGPIERTDNLLVQIKAEHCFHYDKATYGLKLMAWGYFKKCVIADMAAVYVNNIYGNVMSYSGFALMGATFLFAIQIYCDFSGYSDIAKGSANLLDIDLMDNFKSPYLSKNIKEFWSRWHISLSTWFRDYVYIPLGGNRVSAVRKDINVFITFLASGLWHGANYTYVIWGCLHGVYQIVQSHLPKVRVKKAMPFRDGLCIFLTFLCCCFAWIFFRASSVNDAFYVIAHMFDGINAPISYVKNGLNSMGIFTWHDLIQMLGLFLLLLIYDCISLKKDVFLLLGKCNILIRWIIYIVLGVTIILMSQKGVSTEFVYFQF